MRKTSQDGGDSTSATNGVENEIKKPKSGLLEFKSKKLGKRTAPNLSEESDEAVVEPLLEKNINTASQSAKYFAKAKADTVKEISKLFNDKQSQYASTSGFGTTETLLSEKDQAASKLNPSSNAPLHNYMNTNMFHSHDSFKANGTTKSQILIEIDGSKQSGYNPSPFIFTTAKIHTDGKTKHMEPVQTTPAPISSTVEMSMSKKGSITTNEKKVSNGSSVMNTIQPPPAVNEKPKENTVNNSNSNITVTQNKDILAETAVADSSKTVIENSLPEKLKHVGDKPKQNTVNIINPEEMPVVQSKYMTDKTDYQSKSITTLSNNSLEIHQLPKLCKAITPASVHEKLGKTKDPKMLLDEPRVVMSESKLKSTISDITKSNVSVMTTKSPLDTTVLESKSAQPQITQPKDSEKLKSEKNNISFDRDINYKKESLPLLIKNIESPTTPNKFTSKLDLNSIKPLNQQKITSTEAGPSSIKTELKTDISSSKIPDSSKDPSGKILSSSKKTVTQIKDIDNKISKEKGKSPKPSANELSKTNTKISLNDATTSSSNKIPSSAVVAKSALNVVTSIINDTSKKSLVSNSKAITSTVTTSFSSSAIKTQSTSTKTETSTVNKKPTSVPSTKFSTKTSLVSSIKSPQTTSSTSTSEAKQPNSGKNTFSQPPSLASTKTPPATSSPSVTAAIAKPTTVSKSTNIPAGKTSPSLTTSSTAAVEATNKTKALELIKSGGSKHSDSTKVTKA